MTGRGPRGLIRPVAAAAAAETRMTYVYRVNNGSINQFVVPSSGTGYATPGAPLAYADGEQTVVDLRLEGVVAAGADVTFEIQRSADYGATWSSLSTPFSVTVGVGDKAAITAGPSVALSDGDWVSLKCTADNGGALGEWGLSFRI